MALTFYAVVNNAGPTTPGYTAGAGTLNVAAGKGALFGAPTADAPMTVSTFLADGTPKGVYLCTGRATDALTIPTLLSGTDTTLPAGSLVKANWTAENVRQITDALALLAGTGTAAAGTGAAALGDGTVALGDGAFTAGQGTTAVGTGASARGSGTTAVGPGCSADGFQCVVIPATGAGVTISGAVLTAAGQDLSANFTPGNPAALYSLYGGTGPAAALGTIDTVVYTGTDTVITLTAAVTTHTAGQVADLTMAPEGAHAEGESTVVTASYGHAEGQSCQVYEQAGHAEGGNTVVSGRYGHAEGEGTATAGRSGHAEGAYAAAPGEAGHAEGTRTTAAGDHSHAGGVYATAPLWGQWARSDGRFAAAGDRQHSLLQLAAATADATPTVLAIDPGGTPRRLAVRANTTAGFLIHVLGRQTDGTAHAHFLRQCLISNEAGTTALVGSVATVGTDNNVPGWTIAVTADDTNDALAVTVTGAAATDIRWVAVACPMVEVAS